MATDDVDAVKKLLLEQQQAQIVVRPRTNFIGPDPRLERSSCMNLVHAWADTPWALTGTLDGPWPCVQVCQSCGVLRLKPE